VRVGVLESRKAGELAALIRHSGGEPICATAVREVPVECREQVASLLNDLRGENTARHFVIFLTAPGVTALFAEAEALGCREALIRGLSGATLICRGPKPASALKKYGLSPAIPIDEPYTSVEVLAALKPVLLGGTRVSLIHYGERNHMLADALRERGAALGELCLYEWLLPDDVGPLERMIDDLIASRLHAVVLTSQVQCRHLFEIARRMGRSAQLREALTSVVAVAVIGPVCRAAVLSHGIRPHVEPEHPRVGPLISSLASYLAARG